MTPWTALLPRVMPHVIGCPEPLAIDELRRAAQRFYRQTRAIRSDSAPVAVAAQQAEVPVAPTDPDQRLAGIESAWYDELELSPVTEHELDNTYGRDWVDRTGRPSCYYMPRRGVLRLFPTPDVAAATGLRVRAWFYPADSAAGLDDDEMDANGDAFVDGALSRLMIIPGRPWTDMNLATARGSAFNKAVEDEGARATRSNVGARIYSRVRWF